MGDREIKDTKSEGSMGEADLCGKLHRFFPEAGQDIEEWAVPNNADYIALSFVQMLALISPQTRAFPVSKRANAGKF